MLNAEEKAEIAASFLPEHLRAKLKLDRGREIATDPIRSSGAVGQLQADGTDGTPAAGKTKKHAKKKKKKKR